MVRQLTAIMFTDMVGYTALMQADERLAKRNRDRHRRILESCIEEHGGRILQYYGDGTLSVFQSAIEAARCGIAIQRALQQEDPPIPVRIGVHTGDVVHDDEGVFGDGVNVAARIQGLSVPGAVLISEKVFDEVKNQTDLPTRSLGSFSLKNVQRPMDVYALTNDGLTVPGESALAPARSGRGKSIAVLPFVNMSADPENEFFSDGITEEVINALTRINGLQVTARTSSFAFKNHNDDIRRIAEQLGVTHILEGSVRRAGDQVRVTAQLICAKDGYHLFSDIYDGRLEDIFALQDDIARAIVDRLASHLSPVRKGAAENGAAPDAAHGAHPDHGTGDATPRLARVHTHDTDAYAEYLRGRFHWAKWTPEGARLAISHYRRSVRMDPTCALPYAGLATAHVFLGGIGHMPADRAFAAAEEAALKALELEEDEGSSHVALGAVRLFHKWDWDGAYRSFQKALTLTPGSAEAHQLYATYLATAGEVEEAVEEARTAVELDPLSLPANHALAQALAFAGRYEEALEQAELCLAMDPAFRSAIETKAFLHLAEGDLDQALASFEEFPIRAGNRYAAAAGRGYVYGLLGREDDARRMLALLDERQAREPDVNLHMDRAVIHMGLGDADEAFRHMRAALESRIGFMVFLRHSPWWKKAPLRADPRFEEILAEIGAPQPALA